MKEKRASFGSKLGMVAAAAGSAVGLGNLWRFPSEAADGGGALFIMVYILLVLFFGVPVMMAEFLIGRSSRVNASAAFVRLSPHRHWSWVGRLGILASFVILGFYMVVAGWTLDYIYQSMSGNLAEVSQFSLQFEGLLANKVRQVSLMLVFVLLTAFFIYSGVQKGIERSAKIMMPVLFVLMIVLMIKSVSLEGASEGLSFLFKPDFTSVKPTIFIDAMGQAFFSLSLGMAAMLTYASYFSKDTDLTKTAIQVSLLDTLVAMLAGLIIFPSAFALAANSETIVDSLVAGGPGLLFITLPELFNEMQGAMVWSSMFFLLLGLAALTSTISLMEVVTVYVMEEYKMTRNRALLYVVLGVVVLGVFSAIYPWFFDLLDMATAKVMLPIGGLFISIFVGWHLDRRIIEAQLTNDGSLNYSVRFLKGYSFILKYIAPVAIIIIFAYGFIG